MSNEDRCDVYSLRFIRSLKVFYVGIAADPYKRFIQHLLMDGSNKEKDAIIANLKRKGVTPHLQTEATCHSREQAELAEAYFIEYYRMRGHPICNQRLPLSRHTDAARCLAIYHQRAIRRYSSKCCHFFDKVLPFFMFNPHKREEFTLQRDEDYMLADILVTEQYKIWIPSNLELRPLIQSKE